MVTWLARTGETCVTETPTQRQTWLHDPGGPEWGGRSRALRVAGPDWGRRVGGDRRRRESQARRWRVRGKLVPGLPFHLFFNYFSPQQKLLICRCAAILRACTGWRLTPWKAQVLPPHPAPPGSAPRWLFRPLLGCPGCGHRRPSPSCPKGPDPAGWWPLKFSNDFTVN